MTPARKPSRYCARAAAHGGRGPGRLRVGARQRGLGVTEAVAYLAPALLLLALVASAAIRASAPIARRIAAVAPARPRRARRGSSARARSRALPRGGVLLAAGLAGRAPPPAPLCAGPRRAPESIVEETA